MTLLEQPLAPTPAGIAPTVAAAGFHPVCAIDRLTPDRGVAALVEGTAVALFHLSGGEIAAIDNVDPASGASVLSRGIVGEVEGVPTVASPLYKQRFDLRSGRCLDDEARAVRAHEVRCEAGVVHVRLRR
ncbi:MAG: nitrite reductase small subunit NirD [Acidimicrobiia bacterium]|nr:nitrite reductase small subunit NirD [Acidimicrobiia bacterium]